MGLADGTAWENDFGTNDEGGNAMTPKMTQEEVIQLFFEGDIVIDDEFYTVEDEGDFEQDGKYQYARLIFTDGDTYFRAYIQRSGSPFTDWHYDDYGDADIDIVTKQTITIEEWV